MFDFTSSAKFAGSIVKAAALAAAGLTTCGAWAQTVFTYPDFASTAGLTLNGAAQQSGNAISVTPPVRSSAGSMWHSAQVPVSGSWSSAFHFRISDIAGQGADGFAFVVQSSSAGVSALGGRGGALGYATNPIFSSLPGNTGIERCLAVEFDTWDNATDWDDFGSGQHVSVHSRGVLDNLPSAGASLAHAAMLTDFADGNSHLVVMSYTGNTLSVFLDANLIVTTAIDFRSALGLAGGQAWVGFTAGTGALQNVERHEILDWDFNVIPGPSSFALLGAASLLIGARRRVRHC